MRVVDVSFAARSEHLPRDYGYALFRALADVLEWLEEAPLTGVHPLQGTTACNGGLLLGPRARLVLRVPAERAGQALALAGRHLDIGSGLEVGAGRQRELMPFSTVHSHFVSAGCADEIEFLDKVAAELRETGLPERMIAGKAHAMATCDAEVCGFSLLLHGLSPAQSLDVQARGIGQGRKLGCGIFVPYKSIIAVGAAE